MILCLLTDPPERTIDDTSVQDFKDLLNLNLVNYFIFCKVSCIYTVAQIIAAWYNYYYYFQK